MGRNSAPPGSLLSMRQTVKLLLATLALSASVAACGSSSSSSTGSSASGSSAGAAPATVKSARSAKLGATVLVDAQGMTLYSLSAEKNGKFICTNAACLQTWHPLSPPASGPPKGSVGQLSTVRRPDGAVQVAYKGMPLYTFAQDQSPGDAKGQGFKDVGTWRAVTTSSSATAAPSAPAPQSSPSKPSGGGYGY
jgi:predicted lipoprotein with Yx(FWY)xxD motif